jgi:ElaB/YqjD/DUF883 family membrane-anchored ribosome-binding protein
MPAVAKSSAVEPEPTVVDRVAEAVRRVAHASHETQLLKTVAEDALEDGAYAARRAIKNVRHRLDDLGDLRDEAARCVKRQPLVAVGVAFGAGVAIGVIAAWAVTPARLRV